MYLNLLFEPLDGAPATTRLFLLRFLKIYGDEKQVVKSVREFVRDLGIHDRGVRSALDFLVSNQYIRSFPAAGRSNGTTKPRRVFEIGSRLIGLFQQDPVGYRVLPHAETIGRILVQRPLWNTHEGRKTSSGLKSKEVLLLSILYAHADLKGEVIGIAFRVLGAYSGLNNTQLRRSIKLLIREKYILKYMPGGMRSDLDESWVGSYCLNIDQDNTLSSTRLLLESYALRELKRSFYLAKGLSSVYGNCKYHEMAKSTIEHWVDLYKINEDLWPNIVECMFFLSDVRNAEGKRFENSCNLLVSAAFEYLKKREDLDVPPSSEEWFSQNVGFQSYVKRWKPESKKSLITFFNKIFDLFFQEIISVLSQGKVIPSSVYAVRLLSDYDLVIDCITWPKDEQKESN